MLNNTLNKLNISDIDSDPNTRNDIMFCFKEEEIDDFFHRHNISKSDFTTRTQVLEKVMGIEKSYSVDDKVSDEDEYKVRLSIFLDGTWRMFND